MKTIFNVPHTSKFIPKKYLDDYTVSLDELVELNEMYHDKYISDIIEDINSNDLLSFEYSRLFCDVERFNDDTEEMNKYGRGILYTHDHNFNLIRNVKNKDSIIEIYNNYHIKLTNLVDNHIKNGKVLIIDLHSYSEELIVVDKNKDLPDLCIGIDYYHYDENIINKILNIIKKEKIIYNINYPYSGTIVPIKHYKKNKDVISIMLDFKKDFLKENIEKIKKVLKCIKEI